MKNIFGFPDDAESPEPETCPCLAVNRFKCEARKRGKPMKLCVSAENYKRCPNFSAWFWYKVAQEKVKTMKYVTPNDDDGDDNDFLMV